MYHINASKERLKAVEILTVPGLFTIHRVDRTTLPPWMHLYEMQSDPIVVLFYQNIFRAYITM